MNAIDATMIGTAWQRCRVHFMRNVLTRVPKGQAEMVAAAIGTIFAQPTGVLVRAHVGMFSPRRGALHGPRVSGGCWSR